MEFFNNAVTVLRTLVIALGAGLAFGAQSTCSRATAMTIRVQTLRASLHREGWAVVRTSSAMLRACPDHDAPSPGTLFCGTPVRVLKEAEQWCEVAVGMDGPPVGLGSWGAAGLWTRYGPGQKRLSPENPPRGIPRTPYVRFTRHAKHRPA